MPKSDPPPNSNDADRSTILNILLLVSDILKILLIIGVIYGVSTCVPWCMDVKSIMDHPIWPGISE
jgi:hypothetical protein